MKCPCEWGAGEGRKGWTPEFLVKTNRSGLPASRSRWPRWLAFSKRSGTVAMPLVFQKPLRFVSSIRVPLVRRDPHPLVSRPLLSGVCLFFSFGRAGAAPERPEGRVRLHPPRGSASPGPPCARAARGRRSRAARAGGPSACRWLRARVLCSPAHRAPRAARGTWRGPSPRRRRRRRRCGSRSRPAWAAPSTCPTRRPPPPPPPRSTTRAPRCPRPRAGAPRWPRPRAARPPSCSAEARPPRAPPTPRRAAPRPSSRPAAWPSPTAPARPSTSSCPRPACPRSA